MYLLLIAFSAFATSLIEGSFYFPWLNFSSFYQLFLIRMTKLIIHLFWIIHFIWMKWHIVTSLPRVTCVIRTPRAAEARPTCTQLLTPVWTCLHTHKHGTGERYVVEWVSRWIYFLCLWSIWPSRAIDTAEPPSASRLWWRHMLVSAAASFLVGLSTCSLAPPGPFSTQQLG